MNPSANQKELPVVDAAFGFAEWSCKISQRFPRIQRRGLGERMEHQLFYLMECLLEAKYAGLEEKDYLLKNANMCLTKYRFYARLARNMQCLSNKVHQEATRRCYEIGVQVHSWRSLVQSKLKKGGV